MGFRDDRTRHVEAHHFCKHRSHDMHQWCVRPPAAPKHDTDALPFSIIYDSDEPNARLIGIEYIVTEKVRELCLSSSARVAKRRADLQGPAGGGEGLLAFSQVRGEPLVRAA
jgi:hypothetical protein